MNDDERIKFWKESERQLRSCLDLSQLRDEHGKSEVLEFMQHNEHLLAFEELALALHESNYEIDGKLGRALQNLAKRFNLSETSPAYSFIRSLAVR